MNTPNTIAILGGTFDPIHNGHINSAQHVAQWLGINQVSLIPTHLPPHKNTVSATAEQRVDMVQLVCESHPLFSCDQRELNRTGLSYTVETLKEIKQDHPEQTIFFIIGMDSLLTFQQWHQWQEILTLCHLVVNCRPNHSTDNLSDEVKLLLSHHKLSSTIDCPLLSKDAGYIIFPPEIFCDVSSTLIRNNIKNSLDCQKLIPENVLNYINQHQLYR